MTNYNYKNFNANEIANRIIAREQAYLNTNYEDLSFEDKCRYALNYTPIVHPIIAPNPEHRASLLNALRPELLRRAEMQDAFALYVLGSISADLSSLPTGDEREYLERSSAMGYTPATIALVDRFFNGRKNRKLQKQALHEYLIPAINRLREENPNDLQSFYAVAYLLSEYETDSSARVAFYAMARKYAAEIVSQGSYVGLSMLCKAHVVSDSVVEIAPEAEEIDFWLTVDFLVHSRLYDCGANHLADTLTLKILNQRGCDCDLESVKKIDKSLI